MAILQALAGESRSLIDLRRALGSPPQTTMRSHLQTLIEVGALERRRQSRFPGALDLELTAAGRDLLGVADVLAAWLAAAPHGPLQLETSAAKSVVKALVEGWSTTIVRALAARPLTLTQLSGLISDLSYPSLERRLTAMRLAGQLEAGANGGRGRPHFVTEWLRRAVAPLGAAARWEQLNSVAGAAPMTRLDIEAAFLLAVPLLSPPADLGGSCRLTVEVPMNGRGRRLAGVLVVAEASRIVSCSSRLDDHADAWVSGSAPAWFPAVIERDTSRLELGGDTHLGAALVAGLHESLFGSRGRAARRPAS